jgi:predicted transcriptional regulator
MARMSGAIMAKERRPAMSEAETEVLNAVWQHGPGTVRELHEALGPRGQHWTRSTVITLLQRLEKKGYLTSDKRKFAFVFRAVATREQVMHERMLDLADELCEGEAAPLVLAFAQQHQFTEDEIAGFRQLIDQMESKRRRRATR